MAWGVAWTGLTLCTFAFFDLFDRYRWREEDWFNFTVIWLLPIFGGWLATRLVRWAAAGSR